MKKYILPFSLNSKNIKILHLSFSFLLFFSSSMYAAEKFIGGGGNHLFTNAANWAGGSLPNPGDDIQIKANCIFDQPGSIEYDKLTIKDGAILSWANSSFTLNIKDLDDHGSGGTLDMSNAGILIIRQDWKASVDNLIFISGSGSVIFQGTGNNSHIPTEFLADIAHSWGDHALAGYLTSFTELDPIFTASAAASILGTDITNWNNAYGWGDHASAGYLTSFTEADPVFGASSAASILGTDITNWNIAYGWGDHAGAGYLTSFTEADPVFGASYAASILGTDITNWNNAYGWGDHAGAGYLTSFTEADPVFGASSAASILGTDITNWDTAYGWGDHAGAGYLSSLSGAVLTTTDQNISGTKNFTSDATINGITVGAGPFGAGGSRNTAFGLNALSNNAAGGHHNVAIGTNAMKDNTTGSFNLANGFWALTKNTTGIHNAANGRLTLAENVSGSYSTATGSGALNKNTTGSFNTATGSFALYENTTGSQNTATGYYSLNNNITGSQNTAIGVNANVASGSLTNATVIGANAIVDASNKIQLGNNAINSVQLGTGSNVTLETGLIKITGGSPAAGKVLTSDIDGLASWQNAASESDPVFGASSASGILGTDITNWDTAYGWGDHAGAGYITSSGTVQGTGANSLNIRAANEGTIPGNTRGEYSVDFQTFRASATQVASGYVSTIGGGYSNTASGSRSTIGGGYINTASGFESIVGGGSQNTASQSYSTIGGGFLNTASGYSSTIAGGNGNTASVIYATVGGGTSNTASGHYSSVPGGLNNIASADFSTAMGNGITVANTGELHNSGDIRSAGTILTSDIRYKKDVKNLSNAMDKVLQLQGVSYKYRTDKHERFEAEKGNTQIGFIAQDVQKVLPELVSSDGTDDAYLGIRYANMSAVLVEAIKEQQDELDSKDERIADLEDKVDWLMAQVRILTGSENENTDSNIDVSLTEPELPWIKQNTPNPFEEITIINYFIPDSNQEASIEFLDIQGKLIKKVPITEKGKGSIDLRADNLSAGTYLYRLLVDGNHIDTKKMNFLR